MFTLIAVAALVVGLSLAVVLDRLGEDRRRERAPLRSACRAFLRGEEHRLPSGGGTSMNVVPK